MSDLRPLRKITAGEYATDDGRFVLWYARSPHGPGWACYACDAPARAWLTRQVGPDAFAARTLSELHRTLQAMLAVDPPPPPDFPVPRLRYVRAGVWKLTGYPIRIVRADDGRDWTVRTDEPIPLLETVCDDQFDTRQDALVEITDALASTIDQSRWPSSWET